MVQLAVVEKSHTLTPPETKPKLGWYVYLLSISAVIGGFLFGYDTGIVSSAMLYVKDSPGIKPMSDLWQELIIAITSGKTGIKKNRKGLTNCAFFVFSLCQYWSIIVWTVI